MTTADVRISQSELEQVVRWRAEALERAGYDSEAASELAEHAEVDLHAAIALIERGCPPDLAVRILL